MGGFQAGWIAHFWGEKGETGSRARAAFEACNHVKERDARERGLAESNAPVSYFVRYTTYMDGMARDMGLLPPPDDASGLSLAERFREAWILLFGPPVVHTYFLPHTRPFLHKNFL